MTDTKQPYRDDPTRKASADLFSTWWYMHRAQAECIDEPIDPNVLVLHFMGSGASCQVFAKDLDAACEVIKDFGPLPVADGDKLIVPVEFVEALQQWRRTINAAQLDNITWTRRGRPIEVAQATKDNWKFLGLSNHEFPEYLPQPVEEDLNPLDRPEGYVPETDDNDDL